MPIHKRIENVGFSERARSKNDRRRERIVRVQFYYCTGRQFERVPYARGTDNVHPKLDERVEVVGCERFVPLVPG